MEKTFAVIGLGMFGLKVCQTLMEKGGQVIAMDNRPEQINKIRDSVTQAILLDATDEDSIREAPFDQVDAAIVAIGDNIEASILTTNLLKQTGVPYIVARAVNKTHYQVLRQIGADEVINIEEDQGRQIALNLIAPSVMEKIPLSKDIFLLEMYLPGGLENTRIDTLDLLGRFSLRLTGLRRTVSELNSDGTAVRSELLLFPAPEDKLIDGDILILIGSEENLELFRKSTDS
ncbi:MAG: TrkA family potassium uptake protein [Spirochaetales bacterium]|nr:TrkA family potassium uptake protein [Spirochaetales bacterium]